MTWQYVAVFAIMLGVIVYLVVSLRRRRKRGGGGCGCCPVAGKCRKKSR